MKRFNILFIGLFMLYTQLSFADDCDSLGNCDVRNICIKMVVDDCLQGGTSFSNYINSKTLRASISKDIIAQKQVNFRIRALNRTNYCSAGILDRFIDFYKKYNDSS